MATAQHTTWSRNRWGILTGESPISSDIMRAQHESGAENKDWDANNARPRLALDANPLPGKVAYAMKSCFSETHTLNGSKSVEMSTRTWRIVDTGFPKKMALKIEPIHWMRTDQRTYPTCSTWAKLADPIYELGRHRWSCTWLINFKPVLRKRLFPEPVRECRFLRSVMTPNSGGARPPPLRQPRRAKRIFTVAFFY